MPPRFGGGFLTMAEQDRTQSVITEAKRYVYLPRNFPDVSSFVLLDTLKTNLFGFVLSNSHHVLF